VHIWSITSFTELNREAEACERFNRLNPNRSKKTPLVTQLFDHETGVCVSVTDYMKALAASISRWVPLPYTSLGTDGVGLSESRSDLRDYFEISDKYIVAAALSSITEQGHMDNESLIEHLDRLGVQAEKFDPVTR
jgi:pyruvate dehydrogenase E1 component